MRRTSFVLVALISFIPAVVAGGQQPVAVSDRVESVSLFKNGLAVIRRVIDLPQPIAAETVFELASVPDPVHGTFWIESNAEVVTRVTSREIEVSADAPAGWDIQTELAGREVTVHLKDATATPISGRVCEFKAEPARVWDRGYESDAYGHRWGYWPGGAATTTNISTTRFLVLESENGRVYVDTGSIASLAAVGAPAASKRRQNVLQFTVNRRVADEKVPATITVSYLTKGMSWAPSYRVDMTESTTLALTQQAVIRNELEDLREAEIYLISGYPSMEFAGVTSLLSPRTSLAAFFRDLGSQPLAGGRRREVITQQAVMSNYYDPNLDAGADLTAPPLGEGVDLHFQSIGRHTLHEGDSLMLTVAQGEASYERIVEWMIPDSRNEYGQVIDEYRRRQSADIDDESPWDALHFRNPLPFAMTTAAAMIVDGGRFCGQRMSTWTNAGEQASLRITKALSIRTRSIEREEPDEREAINLGGHRFQRVTVTGELSVANHRAEDVKLVIRRRFSGDLVSADDSPKAVLLEQGVYSINQRNELVWSIDLAPGAEKTLKYCYKVLASY